MKNNNHKEPAFSEETLQALKELGVVLRGVHNRMIKEGYHIVNDKIVSIETGEEWVRRD